VVGRVFGERYRILRRIGEGGMGAVYLCEHVVLHRKLALKILRRELSSDPEIVERFRNEAIAASQIGQENVVDVIDIGRTDDGALYYVMEALDGHNVGAVLRSDGPLAVPRALAILEQVARALAAAHARGVVHRDLKPENVFVVRREDGTELAKLLDFGISKVEAGGERLTQAGAIIGTPEYMSPEQAAGATIDHRADVYGLGVMAYELLTGVLPFEGDSAIATLVAHQTRPPEPPSRRRAGVPPEVDALVLRAMAKRPEDRFDSMNQLVAELARIRSRMAGETPEPMPILREPGVTPRIDLPPFRPSRRGETLALPPGAVSGVRRSPPPRSPARVAAGIAAVIALVAMAALAGWWIRGLGGGEPQTSWPGGFPVAPGGTSGRPAAPPAALPSQAPAPAPSSTTGETRPEPIEAAPAQPRSARSGPQPTTPPERAPGEAPRRERPRSTGDLKPDPFR
jgi:serine/threonine-protein kinase